MVKLIHSILLFGGIKMNKIIFVLFLITLLNAGELEELEQAKLLKKKKKLIFPNSGTISVILQKEDINTLNKITQFNEVSLKTCILPTMCLFEVKKNLQNTIKNIKKLPFVKKVELLSKKPFKPY